ncbi:tRNA lysidine(34) synthetase TilS [Jatrophihabitans telluris]|uniref:tRNA(Ile)-lysidine synthase n=1 Tax=Jatrophihabitans telluris TaxID=2038343 RepID=A0ABY4QZH3_9ACTN|nr:tRNA lysidine(34) synthetase TilS [Jatrophihabitans telluris]UQX88913.1 tRNA lysidine(34) synthetase TilS [Jatrophihabitans telluris]
MGPHPAVAAVRRAVRRSLGSLDELGTDRPVVVACSGGADSLALAAATAFEAARTGRPHALVTVDHGLQADSWQQARRVAQLGYDLGFDPVHIVAVSVADGPGAGGPEAAARTARYRAVAEVADGFGRSAGREPDHRARAGGPAAVLLGHTADDQAETVLLGLGRGSGLASIAGMRAQSGSAPRSAEDSLTHPLLVRPFLQLRRTDTLAASRSLQLPVWDDPHNVDPRYRRVRLRSEAVPLLEEILGGGVVEALARTATQVQDAVDALDQLASRELGLRETPGGGLSVEGLEAEPRAVRTRVLKRWAEEQGADALTSVHVGALEDMVTGWRGQGPIHLPGGCHVRRTSGRLVLSRPDS